MIATSKMKSEILKGKYIKSEMTPKNKDDAMAGQVHGAQE
jgi:hypothetical protein